MTMTPDRRSTPPSITTLRQFHNSRLRVSPRFKVILANFVNPGIFRTPPLSFPSRYSITSVSVDSPIHSVNPATCRPLISTRKLNALYGSLRLEAAMTTLPLSLTPTLPGRVRDRLSNRAPWYLHIDCRLDHDRKPWP